MCGWYASRGANSCTSRMGGAHRAEGEIEGLTDSKVGVTTSVWTRIRDDITKYTDRLSNLPSHSGPPEVIFERFQVSWITWEDGRYGQESKTSMPTPWQRLVTTWVLDGKRLAWVQDWEVGMYYVFLEPSVCLDSRQKTLISNNKVVWLCQEHSNWNFLYRNWILTWTGTTFCSLLA